MSESITVRRPLVARRIRQPLRLLAALLLSAALLIGLSATGVPEAAGSRPGWFLTGGFALFAIWLTMRATGLSWAMPPIMYMLVLWVFHFGLTFPTAVIPDIIARYVTDDPRWLYSLTGTRAVLNSFIFFIAYALAVTLFGGSKGVVDDSNPPKALELVLIGRLVVVAGLGLALVWVAEYGLSTIAAGYGQFFRVQSLLTWATMIAATGMMFQIAGGSPAHQVWLYSLYTIIPLMLALLVGGARTAVFFPIAAVLSLWYVRGLRLAQWVIVIGALLNLVLIATIRETRHNGIDAVLQQRQQSVDLSSPTDALLELGASLRPVYATIDYVDRRGDYMYGATYVFPFVRQFERLFGDRQIPSVDERFIATRITGLYGAIGYSVVAEAYINGGPIGVLLFAFIWGVMLSWLTRRAVGPYTMAVLATVLIPMYINVRNSFIFVPAWVLLALVIVAGAYLFVRLQLLASRKQRQRRMVRHAEANGWQAPRKVSTSTARRPSSAPDDGFAL